MMVPGFALVTTRNKHQWPVFLGHVIKRDTHFENVVVGMWVERPVLVPLYRGPITAVFHIELVVVVAKIMTEQAFHNIQYALMAGVFGVRRVDSDRMLEAAHAGRCSTMPGFKIKDLVVRGDVTGVFHKLVCHLPQFVQFGCGQDVLKGEVAIAFKGIDLGLVEHDILPSMSTNTIFLPRLTTQCSCGLNITVSLVSG